jgi:hypothetical protein
MLGVGMESDVGAFFSLKNVNTLNASFSLDVLKNYPF